MWPARLSTPPFAVAQREDVARPGEVVGPGRRVDERATVVARSAAEMPVVVPWRASTDTVNAVRCASVLLATISGSWSSSRRSPSSGMQITPLVWRIMNPIASGVTFSAAMMRSPFVLAVGVVDDDHELALERPQRSHARCR